MPFRTKMRTMRATHPICVTYLLNSSPVHKLLGNFSATLGLFGNFQLVEQLSVHWETSKLLCLYSRRHAPATSETIKSAEYKNIACVENIFVQSFSFTIR